MRDPSPTRILRGRFLPPDYGQCVNPFWLCASAQQRECGTCFRVARGDHRVIGTEAPLRPVLLRGEPAPSEMPLHRFVAAAILKADDVVRADSLVDWHRRRELFVRLSRR